MSKRKGMSADDKRRVILKIYHERKEPFNLKEIETIASSFIRRYLIGESFCKPNSKFKCLGPVEVVNSINRRRTGGSYEKAVKISPCPKMKNMTNWAHPNISFDCHSHFKGRTISLLAVMSILRVLVLFYYIGMKTVKNLAGKKLKTRKFEIWKKKTPIAQNERHR